MLGLEWELKAALRYVRSGQTYSRLETESGVGGHGDLEALWGHVLILTANQK